MGRVVGAIDRFLRRHPRRSIPLAVIYKFFEDQGNYLAATVTYYAFIAIFPLLLLASSILGFVLQGNPELQESILNSALGEFPIIGDQLGRPEGLTGSTGAVIIGSLAALYGAMGLGQSIQNSMHVVWAVPRNSRPNPFMQRAKSLLLLMTAGVSIIVLSVVSALGSSTDFFGDGMAMRVRWLITLATIMVVGTVLAILFGLAAAGKGTGRSLRRAAPGAFAVAIMWQGLQYLGTWYVSRVLVNTTAMNATFGLVLGLIGLIYIASVMAIVGIEINVVLARKLYPRALLTPFTDAVDLTDADRRAYAMYAEAQRYKGFQTVEVWFEDRSGQPTPVESEPGLGPVPEPAKAEPTD